MDGHRRKKLRNQKLIWYEEMTGNTARELEQFGGNSGFRNYIKGNPALRKTNETYE